MAYGQQAAIFFKGDFVSNSSDFSQQFLDFQRCHPAWQLTVRLGHSQGKLPELSFIFVEHVYDWL